MCAFTPTIWLLKMPLIVICALPISGLLFHQLTVQSLLFSRSESIFLCSSLGNILSKSGLPYIALPYNIVILCSMTLLINSNLNLKHQLNQTSLISDENEVLTTEKINWESVFKGFVNSFGQIWCLDDDPVGSGLLVIIIGLVSPLTLTCQGVGALSATLGAVFISAIIPGSRGTEVLLEAYRGLWGFQGILSMTGIACVYFAFNGFSFSLGLLNCLMSVFVQFGLGDAFRQRGIPVFTLPFTLCSMVMIQVTDKNKQLIRIYDLMGYPEIHANKYLYQDSRQKQSAPEDEDEDEAEVGSKFLENHVSLV